MPALLLEGTPIDVVINKTENRKTNLEGGKGELTSKDVAHLKGSEKVKAKKKVWAEEDGHRGQGDGQEMLKKNKKKPSHKGSDDKTSRRSKRTKSNDEGLVFEGNQGNGAEVNLEAIKGLLKKKGIGATKSKGSGKNDKKMARFVEIASKEVPQKSKPAVKYNKCVVAFAI